MRICEFVSWGGMERGGGLMRCGVAQKGVCVVWGLAALYGGTV